MRTDCCRAMATGQCSDCPLTAPIRPVPTWTPAAPVGDDAALALRLHDLTAPEYIDGHPWASEHDRVLLEAAERLVSQAARIAELERERDKFRDMADRIYAEFGKQQDAWIAARAALAPPAAEGDI